MSSRFELFGPAHLFTLGALAVLAVGLVRLGRSGRLEGPARIGLSLALVAGVTGYLYDVGQRRAIRLTDVLPLHLCDMAILLALLGLVAAGRGRFGETRLVRWSTELLYFWTTTGTLFATLTPALGRGPPSLRFFTYFTLHGGVILAAVYLVLGLGLVPRRGAVLRVWLFTNIYAAAVLVFNLVLEKNYLYLLEKPSGPTLLDWLGPWPLYILVCDVLALLLFMGVSYGSRWARWLPQKG